MTRGSKSSPVLRPGTPAPVSGIYQTPAPAPKKVLPRYVLLAANRAPVAPLFFLWEALVLGSAASIVWARRKPPVGEDVGA